MRFKGFALFLSRERIICSVRNPQVRMESSLCNAVMGIFSQRLISGSQSIFVTVWHQARAMAKIH